MEDSATIEALDYSDKPPSIKRYWKEPTGHLCSICLEPNHQARDCDHQLCLTCGAIDEHITRECPVSLVCRSCGSRGHLSRHCPSTTKLAGTPCGRCRSSNHLTLNCPSIWRKYDEEFNRAPKKVTRACYYCGETGDHFGDECPFRRSNLHTEPSAFTSRSLVQRDKDAPRRLQVSTGIDRYSNLRRVENDRPVSRKDDCYRPRTPPKPERKRTARPGRRDRDRAARDRHVEDDMEDDWFSKRHANPPPTEKQHSRSKRSPQPRRIGGSYKGGYIK